MTSSDSSQKQANTRVRIVVLGFQGLPNPSQTYGLSRFLIITDPDGSTVLQTPFIADAIANPSYDYLRACVATVGIPSVNQHISLQLWQEFPSERNDGQTRRFMGEVRLTQSNIERANILPNDGDFLESLDECKSFSESMNVAVRGMDIVSLPLRPRGVGQDNAFVCRLGRAGKLGFLKFAYARLSEDVQTAPENTADTSLAQNNEDTIDTQKQKPKSSKPEGLIGYLHDLRAEDLKRAPYPEALQNLNNSYVVIFYPFRRQSCVIYKTIVESGSLSPHWVISKPVPVADPPAVDAASAALTLEVWHFPTVAVQSEICLGCASISRNELNASLTGDLRVRLVQPFQSRGETTSCGKLIIGWESHTSAPHPAFLTEASHIPRPPRDTSFEKSATKTKEQLTLKELWSKRASPSPKKFKSIYVSNPKKQNLMNSAHTICTETKVEQMCIAATPKEDLRVRVSLLGPEGSFHQLYTKMETPTLRDLLDACETAFKLHPSVARLSHRARTLDPALSLQQNHVKPPDNAKEPLNIRVDVWKGSRVNLRILFPAGVVVPVACDETEIVGRLKKLICANVQSPFSDPTIFDLEWRYEPLMNSVTLKSCGITTGSELRAVRKTCSPQARGTNTLAKRFLTDHDIICESAEFKEKPSEQAESSGEDINPKGPSLTQHVSASTLKRRHFVRKNNEKKIDNFHNESDRLLNKWNNSIRVVSPTPPLPIDTTEHRVREAELQRDQSQQNARTRSASPERPWRTLPVGYKYPPKIPKQYVPAPQIKIAPRTCLEEHTTTPRVVEMGSASIERVQKFRTHYPSVNMAKSVLSVEAASRSQSTSATLNTEQNSKVDQYYLAPEAICKVETSSSDKQLIASYSAQQSSVSMATLNFSSPAETPFQGPLPLKVKSDDCISESKYATADSIYHLFGAMEAFGKCLHAAASTQGVDTATKVHNMDTRVQTPCKKKNEDKNKTQRSVAVSCNTVEELKEDELVVALKEVGSKYKHALCRIEELEHTAGRMIQFARKLIAETN